MQMHLNLFIYLLFSQIIYQFLFFFFLFPLPPINSTLMRCKICTLMTDTSPVRGSELIVANHGLRISGYGRQQTTSFRCLITHIVNHANRKGIVHIGSVLFIHRCPSLGGVKGRTGGAALRTGVVGSRSASGKE